MVGHCVQARAPAVLALMTAAGLLAGCAAHRAAAPVETNALSEWIERMRVISSEARPLPPVITSTARIETWDTQLAGSLVAAIAAPSAATHIQVATEYRRLDILDHAYAHLSDAIALEPDNATAYDLRARIWRDWRVPHLGYADAYQAVALAPASAEASNTLATLFQGSGNELAARNWYERALTLDPYATYALTNVCHLRMLRGQPNAVRACQYALATTPESNAARLNLAAYTDDGGAAGPAALTNPTAAAFYTNGISLLVRRQYGRALQAFATAVRVNPLLALAPGRMLEDRRAPGE